MILIEQIRKAVDKGDLPKCFTREDMLKWASKNNIVKGDGTKYAESSLKSILPNSDAKNKPTTNNNKKVLRSKKNNNEPRIYWFIRK